MVHSAFIYIHIPFCKQKCDYCSFCSYEADMLSSDSLIEAYLEALIFEINNELIVNNNATVKTVYIGGGTPNILSVHQIAKIIEPITKLNFDTDYEFTIECNPETLSFQFLKDLKTIGINRLSIGAQSFNNKILAAIGRKHDADKIFLAVEYAKQAEFDNISLDLMYGLPLQTIENWNKTLNNVLTLDIEHLSLYGLKIEKTTPIYNHFAKNANIFPDSDIQADMFLLANRKLKESSFIHYEISNYSKEGKESIHNINYWKNGFYYGFGCSACGYLNQTRYYNTSSIQDYILRYKKSRKEEQILDIEHIDNEIMLAFRMTEGINLKYFNEKYNINFLEKFSSVVEKYNDFLELSHNNLKLNLKGMLLSNYIISEFLTL